jgi:competence protein ComEA
MQPGSQEDNMKRNRSVFAWSVVLCVALALGPALAWAQKGKPVSTEKVNLNTATIEQLQTLPGVGPAMAKRVLEYRAKVGKFGKVEELLNVKGFGEKRFQQMKDRLVV